MAPLRRDALHCHGFRYCSLVQLDSRCATLCTRPDCTGLSNRNLIWPGSVHPVDGAYLTVGALPTVAVQRRGRRAFGGGETPRVSMRRFKGSNAVIGTPH